MPADLQTLCFAIAAIVLVGLSKGGFAGLGALGTPLLAIGIGDPVRAAAILLPILIAQDAVGITAFRRHWDRHVLIVMLPGAMLGILLCTLMFSHRLGGRNVYGLMGTFTAVGVGLASLIGLAPVWTRFTLEDPLADGRWKVFDATVQAIGIDPDNVPELGTTGTSGTPTAEALREAASVLPASGARTIMLVSDGESNCGEDPCVVAQDLVDQGIAITVIVT